jgi:hypothetical protein
MGLVIVRAIVIMVRFLTLFVLNAVSLLALIFDPVTCISVVENITQISIVLVSVALLRGSDDVGRVPTWTPMVVRVLTRISSSQARVGSTIIGASNIAWRCLTYTLTSSLSLGNKGVSWSMIILEGKALYAGVR